MKIDQLIYFLEAARFESIQKAARSLAISPSAISHSVTALEEELGNPLFVRERKRIFLTQHGRLLADKAGMLQRELVRIKEELSAPDLKLEGYYRIAATRSLVTRYLIGAWNQFQNEHPAVRAELYTFRTSEVISKVATGELDFGLCYQPQTHPRVEARHLDSEPFVVAMRRGHPALRAKAQSTKGILMQYGAAMPKSSPELADYEFHPALRALGIEPKVSFIYDSYEVAVDRVRNSNLWSLLPERHVLEEGSGLASLRIPKWQAKMDVAAIWPRARPLTRALTELIRLIATEIASARSSARN